MPAFTVSQVIWCQGVQGEPIILAPLLCPLPPSLNPHVEHAHAQTLAWAVKFQLVQPQSKQLGRLGAARLAWLAALANPELSRDDLEFVTDWMTWLTCYDDLCDAAAIGRDPEDWGAMSSRFIAIIQDQCQPQPAEPLACALANLCQRLRQRTDAIWIARFACDVKQCFQANRWETMIHASHVPADLATYTKMRPLTSAVYTCFDLVAISAGLDPSASWLTHAYIEQLENMANNHICWVNDLFGLAKEIKENNQNNLVLVLQHELQLTLQAAVDRAVAMCNAEMNAFLALAALFSTEASEVGCQRYINGLQSWMRGNLDWYAQTGRYQENPVEDDEFEERINASHPIKRQAASHHSTAITPAGENPPLPCAWNYMVLRDELLALS